MTAVNFISKYFGGLIIAFLLALAYKFFQMDYKKNFLFIICMLAICIFGYFIIKKMSHFFKNKLDDFSK
jgi:uncharacterized protein YacL